MITFSNNISMMKVTKGKEIMTNENLILLKRITRMSSERVVAPIRPFTTGYLFLGYCFSCNNFGYK
jgi:hypothetical protein